MNNSLAKTAAAAPFAKIANFANWVMALDPSPIALQNHTYHVVCSHHHKILEMEQ
jgi:hypothetical protein